LVNVFVLFRFAIPACAVFMAGINSVQRINVAVVAVLIFRSSVLV